MKRVLIFLLVLPVFVSFCHAASITWAGLPGSNWNNASNWLPAVVPGAGDDVVFTVSTRVEMDIIPATAPFIYTINSLWVTGNALVILSRMQAGGGERILQVKSVGTSPYGLRIDGGCTLTIDAANTTGTLSYILDMTGGAGVTGQIFGNLFFTGTGGGEGDAHLNVFSSATNYAKLVVGGTGVIKYFDNSGNTGSAVGSYLVMESGSVYEINKNGGSVPDGNWDDHSTLLISGATANGSIVFSQYQYGSLVWDTPLMSAVAQLTGTLNSVTNLSFYNVAITNTNGKELRLKTGVASGAPAYEYTVRNDLDIAPEGILVITGINVINAGAGARLHVMGNLFNAGVLRSDGATGTVNDIELNGNRNQGIWNTGIFSGEQLCLIMNNAAGASLGTPLTLPGITANALQLINGRIKTTDVLLLTLGDNSGYSGGSSMSFIEGPLQKIGDDGFLFPVGKGSIYAPIGFSTVGGMAVTDGFVAEYFRINPEALYGDDVEAPMDHISYVEYWRLEKTAGSGAAPVNVTVNISPYSFAKDIGTLCLAAYSGPDRQWKNCVIAARTPGISSPPYITGNITSVPVAGFSVFTIATTEDEAINPLPLSLISFTAKRTDNTTVLLQWKLVNYGDMKIEIERSMDGERFFSLGVTGGDSASKDFYFNPGVRGGGSVQKDFYYYDRNLLTGVAGYRLKITEADRPAMYSKTVFVNNGATGFTLSDVFPDPVYDEAVVVISAGVPVMVRCTMWNVGGLKVRDWTQVAGAGFSRLTIKTNGLLPGIYCLSVNTLNMKRVVRFVKQ